MDASSTERFSIAIGNRKVYVTFSGSTATLYRSDGSVIQVDHKETGTILEGLTSSPLCLDKSTIEDLASIFTVIAHRHGAVLSRTDSFTLPPNCT